MNVQAAEPGRIQHPLRQNQAVGSHHHDVGLRSFNGLLGGLSVFNKFAIESQAAWLCNGYVVLKRPLLDGRGLQL